MRRMLAALLALCMLMAGFALAEAGESASRIRLEVSDGWQEMPMENDANSFYSSAYLNPEGTARLAIIQSTLEDFLDGADPSADDAFQQLVNKAESIFNCEGEVEMIDLESEIKCGMIEVMVSRVPAVIFVLQCDSEAWIMVLSGPADPEILRSIADEIIPFVQLAE